MFTKLKRMGKHGINLSIVNNNLSIHIRPANVSHIKEWRGSFIRSHIAVTTR